MKTPPILYTCLYLSLLGIGPVAAQDKPLVPTPGQTGVTAQELTVPEDGASIIDCYDAAVANLKIVCEDYRRIKALELSRQRDIAFLDAYDNIQSVMPQIKPINRELLRKRITDTAEIEAHKQEVVKVEAEVENMIELVTRLLLEIEVMEQEMMAETEVEVEVEPLTLEDILERPDYDPKSAEDANATDRIDQPEMKELEEKAKEKDDEKPEDLTMEMVKLYQPPPPPPPTQDSQNDDKSDATPPPPPPPSQDNQSEDDQEKTPPPPPPPPPQDANADQPPPPPPPPPPPADQKDNQEDTGKAMPPPMPKPGESKKEEGKSMPPPMPKPGDEKKEEGKKVPPVEVVRSTRTASQIAGTSFKMPEMNWDVGRSVVSEGGEPVEWMFIDTWYTIGPFPNPKRINLNKKFPPETVVNLSATYPGKDGKIVGWEFLQSNDVRSIPLHDEEFAIYYAYTELYFDQPAELWIAIGSDDKANVWINGLPVWISGDQLKSWRVNEGLRKVRFKKGVNRILYRVENGWKGTAFSLGVEVKR